MGDKLKKRFDNEFIKPFYFHGDNCNCCDIKFKPDYEKILDFIKKEVTDTKKSIITLVDEGIKEKEENVGFLLSYSEIPEEDGLLKVRHCVLRSKIEALTELKQKIEEIK